MLQNDATRMQPAPAAGPVGAGPATNWLRAEGLFVLCLALLLYHGAEHSWVLFAILLLAPDLSFCGYLSGPRIGALCYNVMHSYTGPLVLAMICIVTSSAAAVPLIWAAHIGVDRALGYGLKYPSAFSDTHLGRIGRGPHSKGRKS